MSCKLVAAGVRLETGSSKGESKASSRWPGFGCIRSGAQGKPRAPERRPESFGRCLDDDFPIEAFFVSSLFAFCVPGASLGGSRRCRAASLEVPGGEGEPRAPERWPESIGRGLGRLFCLRHFSVKFGCSCCSWDVLGPSSTPPWATWTLQKHRKPPDLAGKSSSRHLPTQATVLELWASPELLGPP